jgi:alpha-tubulin suppressor-like RCC1 family protein
LGFDNPKKIYPRDGFTFIVKQDGTFWSCGYNYSGNLGLGDTTNRNTFTMISSSLLYSNIYQVGVGILAKGLDNNLYGIGNNVYGTLGLINSNITYNFTQVIL